MSFDAYSNWFEIYLKSKDGVNYSLQSLARGNPTRADLRSPEYAQFVESVKVNVSLFRFIQISVTLRPTFDEAVNMINKGVLGMGFSTSNKSSNAGDGDFASTALSKFGYNEIIVRLHSGNKKSRYFKGMLLVPEFSINQDSIEIQLKAVGFMNFTRQRGTSKTYTGTTYRAIIEELAKDPSNSFTIYVDPADSKANAFLDAPRSVNMLKKNWEGIKDILKQGNLRILDTGSSDVSGAVVMQIASADFNKNRAAPYQFVAFRNIDPSNSIYPIISMRTSIANYAANQTLSSIVNSVSDADKLKPKDDAQAAIGAETSKEFSNGVVSSNGTLPGQDPVDSAAVGKTRSSPMNGGEYLEKMKGYWQSLVDTAMSYELNSIGIPDALPGRPVKVVIGSGVKFLSGTYDCYELEHNWTNNGSETTFNLFNTLGMASALDKGLQVIEKKVTATSDKNIKNSVRTSN
jgi:hypothetical protein